MTYLSRVKNYLARNIHINLVYYIGMYCRIYVKILDNIATKNYPLCFSHVRFLTNFEKFFNFFPCTRRGKI